MILRNLPKVILICTIFSSAMIGSSYILSRFFIRIQKEKVLQVKGYAQKIIKSDVGHFAADIMVRATELANGYQALKNNTDIAVAQIKNYGFTDSEITTGNISVDKIYKRVNGKETNEIQFYLLSQVIKVRSNKVNLIEEKHKLLNSLLANGIEINVWTPEYFISDLNKYKLELLAKAAENAHLRAATIAKNSGGTLGNLNSARQGVIQITAPLSTETSDYGTFNTNSLNKAIKIVVTLEYNVI